MFKDTELLKYEITDANSAVARTAYNFVDIACVYPITPATKMSETVDKLAFEGEKNIFGEKVVVYEPHSEAGSAGIMHGALSCGALAVTFTSSQGLLLMIPEIYRFAGEFLPAVIHVAARSVAKHALSIFSDHSDVYACRQTGIAMICSSNVQESIDFAALAHLCAVSSGAAFMHFFDGLRTSHEIRKARLWSVKNLISFFDFKALENFKKRNLSNFHAVIRGTHQNDDSFFECCEAGNKRYEKIAVTVKNYMEKISKISGNLYKPFMYFGSSEAENIVVAMGSVCETIKETILKKPEEKIGFVKVCLYRPFISELFNKVLPESVKKISVLDKTKEPGSAGEPLFLDILAAVNEFRASKTEVFGGRFGISSKDTIPDDILAVFENMNSVNPKKRFTIGIEDDITNLSLKPVIMNIINSNRFEILIYGVGSDGSVSSAKSIAEIIGRNSDLNIQCYCHHDSKKSGGITVSHLRFGKEKIRSAYFISKADFLICNYFDYIYGNNLINRLKNKSYFLLNCSEKDACEKIPDFFVDFLIENEIRFYTIDASDIAFKHGLGGLINTIMQTAFFNILSNLPEIKKTNLENFGIIKEEIKRKVKEKYISKGEKIINLNFEAIEAAKSKLIDLKFIKKSKDFKNLKILPRTKKVSDFLNVYDGIVPNGTSKNKHMFTGKNCPNWIPENCIQCGICAFVCPHAVIRCIALTEREARNAPENTKFTGMYGFENLKFAIGIASDFCTDCSLCIKACPGKAGAKALEMKSKLNFSMKNFKYLNSLPEKPEIFEKFSRESVKGSQFKRPMLEFSCACPGCGQTAYAKLATQLFGERMYIANATGCSSIWGGTFNEVPFCSSNLENNGNQRRFSAVWQNSLLEDAAELGFGMFLAHKAFRSKILADVKTLKEQSNSENIKRLCADYINTFNMGKENFSVSQKLESALEKHERNKIINEILFRREYLCKKSIWVFGGDGWAYDIGFAGLDHAVSSGEDINILIFDTEMYSNTGGQTSKATPENTVAPFSLAGKKTCKKKLAEMMTTYNNVYAAQVALEANYAQCIKVFVEAENHNGPSIIIAHSPCVGHRIKGGMAESLAYARSAVSRGHIKLFSYKTTQKESF